MKLFNKNYLKETRKKLRNNCTVAEHILWIFLKGKSLDGCKFRRQYSIGNFVVDFCCPRKKLIIEVDGSVHNNLEVAEHDFERQKIIEGLGFKVIRFTNKEVIENTEEVLKKIKQILIQLTQ